MQLIILLVLIIIGIVLAKLKIIKAGYIQWANKWIIYFALPAVALAKIPYLELNQQLIAPVLAPLLVFVASVFVFYYLFKNILSDDEKLGAGIACRIGKYLIHGLSFIVFLLR
ncbi:MAG: hypothetical protein CL843_09955 [Crocinitomicaceae bacterium]|nr:hypothetical protein [Crocinitomicaceae bacterium]